MTPKIRPVRDRLIIDFNNAVRRASRLAALKRLNTFAFSGFDGDQLLQVFGVGIETVNKFTNPVVGEFHSFPALKLSQATKVAALEQPYVVNAVAHHGETRQT